MKSEATSPIPLWRQLQPAASALAAVRAGQSGSTALAAVPVVLRPGVQAIVFHALRGLGFAEALRRQLARKPPPAQADALLCTALALLGDGEGGPYEAFTLVDQVVEAAKRSPTLRAQGGFLNACLRRFLREREALLVQAGQDPVARWNHPRWWIERLRQDHPQHWQAILTQANRPAPMTLRVNTRRTGVAEYLGTLAQAGIDAQAVGEHGVTLARPRPVGEIPGFAEGLASVQDAAAQLAAPLLLQGLSSRESSPYILDACAAPGGKTCHLLELAAARVVALDVDPERCKRIHENLQRLGLQAQVLAADAAQPEHWWPQHCGRELFDAILLDAPCSASGIVRRHPDVRWLRRPEDLTHLAATQARLLATLWPLLKPGGRLLYCTCSVFRIEGERQLQTFLAHNTDALFQPSPGHLIPQTGANPQGLPDNSQRDGDGFYYAILDKRLAVAPDGAAAVPVDGPPVGHAAGPGC